MVPLGETHTGTNTINTPLGNVTAAATSLIKNGTGTWHLPVANTFTGGVEINAGTLFLDHAGALNATEGQQNSLKLNAGTLHFKGSLTLGNGTTGWGLAGGGGILRHTGVAAANLTIRQHGAAGQTFRGSIQDTGDGAITLVKSGPGSLTFLGSAQSYAGPTQIQQGTLKLRPVTPTLPVPGAAWHLDASDASSVTVSAGVVAQWRDKTPIRRDVSPVVFKGTAPPLSTPTYETAVQNGLNVIRFDGINDMMALNSVSGFAADAGTIFVVCSNATNGTDTLKGGGLLGANGLNSATASRGIRGPNAGIWYTSGENTDFCTPYGSEFRVNGALTAYVTPQSGNYWHTISATRAGTAMKLNSIGGFTTLDTTGNDEFLFRGDIGEVIVYSTVLSHEQRNSVEAYLQQKWFGGTVSKNLLPATTAVTVAAGATFDSAADQTVASLGLSGSLKIGAPAGELISTGAASWQGGSSVSWDVSDWNGTAGTGYDVLTANTLTIAASAAAPGTVKIGQGISINYSRSPRTFVLARTTAGVTGFDAAHFTLDAAAFTAGKGTWRIAQNAGNVELQFLPSSPTPYEAWIEPYNLTAAQSLPAVDPDGDGFANVLEFAVNSNPADRAVGVPMSTAVSSINAEDAFTLTLAFRTGAVFSGADLLSGSADGVTCSVQGSDDLATWTLDIDEVSPALSEGLPALPTGWEYHTFRTPGAVSADGQDFMRVRLKSP